jgi:AcrR family transcriptional regulator
MGSKTMKAIQEDRMRGYFLNAAKDLIRAEGIQVVSARNVAERAGYSYATLYNYFKDIRDLIFSCIEDFMKECKDFVICNTEKREPGQDRLKQRVNSYAKFFLQYQGIFVLLYQQTPNDMSTKDSNVGSIYGFFDSLIDDDWNIVGEKSSHSINELAFIKENFKYSIHGLLLFYLNRRKDMEYKGFIGEVAAITELFISMSAGMKK